MRIIAAATIIILSPVLAACSSIYLHDASLAKQTADLEAGFDTAKLTEPFDSADKYLVSLASTEDRAIIELNIASRNRELASLINEDKAESMRASLGAWSTSRLTMLVGAPANEPLLTKLAEFEGLRTRSLVALKTFDDSVQFNQGEYVRRSTAGTKALTCDAALKATKAESAAWAAETNPVKPAFYASRIREACRKRVVYLNAESSLPDLPGGVSGALRQAFEDANEAQEAFSNAREKEGESAIDKLIKEAEEISKVGSVTTYEDLIAMTQKDLAGLSAAARLAGWDKLQGQIDLVLLQKICGKDSIATDAEKAEAKCDAIEPGGTPDKTDAVLRVVAAAARLEDAVALDGRDVNWMLAAKAIAGANVADAKIELARDKAVFTHRSARALALAGEASALACTKLALSKTGCRSARGDNLALASYVESWNVGRIPEVVHSAREIRELRISSVKRSRAAGERQIALLTASARQEKLYGEGGLKPELLAQVLTALGLIAVAEGE